MKKIYLFLALMVGVALMVDCTNEPETKTAELSVDKSSITFDPNVATNNVVTVTSNTDWTVAPSSPDLKLDKTRGSGNGSVVVLSIPAGKSYTFTIKTFVSEVFTNEVSKTITVSRPADGGSGGNDNPDDGGNDNPDDGGSGDGGSGDTPDDEPSESEIIYKESFTNNSVSGTVYADDLKGYSDKSGSGASTVTYDGNSTTVRNDNHGSKGDEGTYSGASGGCYIRARYDNSYLDVKDITLPAGERDLRLSLGAAQPAENMQIFVGDGTNWTELDYEGSSQYNQWEKIYVDFSLTSDYDKISLRLYGNGTGNYGANFDDLCLYPGDGGQQVTIGSGSGGNDDPDEDPNVGTLVYNETFGTETISATTYADEYTAYDTTGSGASSVTYTSQGARVRNDNYGSNGTIGTYNGASGGVYVRVYEDAWFQVNNITLPEGSVNYALNVGGGQPDTDLDIYIGDGTNWVLLDYNNDTPYNTWALGSAGFTLSEPREKLSIKLVGGDYQQHGMNFDDISLIVDATGGQVIDIESGTSTGGGNGDTTVDVTKMGWAELPEMDNSKLQYVAHFAADANGKDIRNYSIGFDKSKKAALWIAYPLHSCYTTKNTGRTDEWAYDPQIPVADQANVSFSYKEDDGSAADYNRGHQIASADRLASAEMNAQTFYFTNMTPQQSDFNEGIWGTLEGAVRNKQCSDTLYVVTGAHFDPKVTMPNAYDADWDDAPVPTHYYKVLIRTKKGNTGKAISECSASELMAIGFWMEHPKTNTSLSGGITSYVKSVAEIEELTGHTFFPTAPAQVKESYTLSDWNF